MEPYPEWLHRLAWAYVSLSFACALIILLSELRRPQKMLIMNLVWVITALYGGPLALWGYLRSGGKMTRQHMRQMRRGIEAELRMKDATQRPAVGVQPLLEEPSREQVAVGTTHCGAGCTLGDIGAEWWVFLMGLDFAGGVFATRILLDFLLAWGFGIVFQYATIAPMRGLGLRQGMLQAMRADTLSIVAFQMGLFAWMALTYFVLFPAPHLLPNQAVFWFMMQVGMILGFFTSYPANVFLLKRGWKEKMPQHQNQLRRKIQQQNSGKSAA